MLATVILHILIGHWSDDVKTAMTFKDRGEQHTVLQYSTTESVGYYQLSKRGLLGSIFFPQEFLSSLLK